jgi:lauroyl/myristoyl acyltransferase
VAERYDNPVPAFHPADVGLVLTELGHAAIVRLLPDATADTLARQLARLAVTLRPGKRRHHAALFRAFAGDRAGIPDPDGYVRDNTSVHLLQRMIHARLRADPTWRPRALRVRGREHVDAALARGRGIVFWLLPLELNAILFRMACRDAGWAFSFMSHWRHGPARSRLGARLVSARDCRMEERFGPRLVMTERDKSTALGQAAKTLRDGGIVGFRGIGWAERPGRYPLLDGHLDLALGAPVMAQRTGAALFTVSCDVAGGALGLEFLPLDAGRGRRPAEIGAEFATRLERAILDCPPVWTVRARQWAPGHVPEAHPASA